ncbi:hypothetical protein WA026_002161 [Henosepilachna vigintioctopunctata]|uniref:Uncharacterized protein n=1 Tax=Henosepilachna vigintioctopunctata TaxID=420089 RepID=A0AAW1U0Z8_9CUCU
MKMIRILILYITILATCVQGGLIIGGGIIAVPGARFGTGVGFGGLPGPFLHPPVHPFGNFAPGPRPYYPGPLPPPIPFGSPYQRFHRHFNPYGPYRGWENGFLGSNH